MLGLLRATGVLCVYGSGFGMPAADGFLRIVFLAPPDELREIYQLMGSFTADYLAPTRRLTIAAFAPAAAGRRGRRARRGRRLDDVPRPRRPAAHLRQRAARDRLRPRRSRDRASARSCRSASALPRWLAILVVYLLIVGTMTIVGLLVIPPLVDAGAGALDSASRPDRSRPGVADSLRPARSSDHAARKRCAARRPPGDAVGTVAMAATERRRRASSRFSRS